MIEARRRFVADIGNTRLKWAPLGPDGQLGPVRAFPIDEIAKWKRSLGPLLRSPVPMHWAISSVNPEAAESFGRLIEPCEGNPTIWFRSAAGIPVRNALESPKKAGADRALAAWLAEQLRPAGRPALVILCGSAITVERITADGTWQGGAIAPGLGLSARALNLLTAQLPLVDFEKRPVPASWGDATVPALEAGLFWGTVGAIRELIMRQRIDLAPEQPWIIWSGGDAERLAPWIEGSDAHIEPNLVLEALSELVFSGNHPE